jgi:threonine dehydrogenase-like Zn-dependent dehydrogenase
VIVRTYEYQLTGPGHGILATRPAAKPGPGQVLMRVAYNGVCASDLAAWAAGPVRSTVRFGHEPVGTIVASGPGVTIPEGAWITGRVSDSYANFAIADVRDVVPVPADVDPSVALGEPVGCVVDGLDRTPLRIGDRVAVIGAGFMGRIAIQLLGHSWASAVFAVDVRDDARRAALADGADTAFAPTEAATHRVAGEREQASCGIDVVIEATGTQSGLDLATAMVRPHGVISILGYHQSSRNVDMATWNWKALEVVNAHVRDRDRLRESVRRGLDLAATNRLDLGALITHRFPSDQIDDAFRALQNKPDGFVKAVIEFTES